MALNRWILLVIFVAAESAVAQADDRPSISIPEPRRESNTRGTFTITAIEYRMADEVRDRFPSAIPELIRYFKASTNATIGADISWNELSLDNPRIMQSLLLYMTGNDAVMQIADAEKNNLGQYLKTAGLLFAEEIRHSDAAGGLMGKDAGVKNTYFDRQFKALVKDPLVLGDDGARWQKVPAQHPVHSIYWDFPQGPPMGGAPGGNVFQLEMLERRGRVVVIFSDLNISWYWGDPLADLRERGLQFGGNLIVFAMSQRVLGPGLRK